MHDPDCIFCQVIRGERPLFKIWEDEKNIAVLDLCPNTKGQSLVMPKAHAPSYQFNIDDTIYVNTLKAAKTVGKILEIKLKVKRVALVIEGTGVNHLHIKLYPLHGLEQEFNETWVDDRIYFKKYEGYISTLMGPRADDNELEKLAVALLK